MGKGLSVRLLWLLLAPVSGALAGDEWRDDGVQALAGELSRWIAQYTGYPEPAPPTIELETRAGLEELWFPRFSHALLPRIRGAYDARKLVIYVNADFDFASVMDTSYLLHELVHHFQMTRRAGDRRSKSGLEAEALRIQLRWLEENGVSDPATGLATDEKSLRRPEGIPSRYQITRVQVP